MATARTQRGEGKIGCILSLVVLVVIVAVGAKVVPYAWSVGQLRDSADELASRGGLLADDTIRAQLRAKAREAELPEALEPNAIVLRRAGTASEGSLVIELHFKREMDLYGVYSFTWTTDKRISKPFMDAR